MAKKKTSGEGKAGLVITLVFFVLASILLGTLAYFGYADQAELITAAKAAKKDSEANKKLKEEETARLLALRIVLGIEGNDDQINLGNMRKARAEIEKAFQDEIKKLQKYEDFGIKWDENQGKTVETIQSTLEKSAKDRATALEAQKQAEKERDEAKETVLATQKRADDAVKKATESLREEQAKVKTIQDAKAKEYDEAVAKIDDLGKTVDAERKLKGEIESKKNTEIAQLKKKVNELTEVKHKLEAKIAPVNMLDFDSPKGEIVRIDRRTDKVYINLGSADRVRPQLTFSILSRDAFGKGAAAQERKGSLEVVEVLEPKLSVCRITDVTNAIRDPILVKDLLFNPAWNPNIKEHIAIVGIVDLNGDGIDDNAELIRSLEKQNVIVDAYLDLRDLQMKGEGMSFKTSYLVVGDMPTIDSTTPFKVGQDPKADRIQAVIKKMSDVRVEARDKGIQIIAARKFLAMIGYPLPRNVTPPDYGASVYLRGGAKPKPEPKPEDKPMDGR